MAVGCGVGGDDSPTLDLWNESYNAMRDGQATGGLTSAYESIVAQQLPDHLKMGGLNSSFRGRSDHDRFELLTAITKTGLAKRRAATADKLDNTALAMSDAARDAVDSLISAFPAAAVAWAGLCTLTPLLLDPLVQRKDLGPGLIHVIGRIPWYMHLPQLFSAKSWADERVFGERQDQTRYALVDLYRAVLELEMNCVCAAASSWNPAAKNVVNWDDLGAVVRSIIQADDDMANLVQQYCTPEAQDQLLRLDTDFNMPTADDDAEEQQPPASEEPGHTQAAAQ
ncbi:hypothetical protein CDD83_3094 [Cordyceps sp. RAO-2017]|nr:hypothetical protein CDD83_3094 [Cordyceps sp. RAO-2017]